MRTTSRSESENHFFGQITSTRLSLVEFVSHYDMAMDLQRFIYGKNNHDSMYTMPDLKTDLLVEKEAAELYTRTLFYDVQEEIYSFLINFYALNGHEGESHRHFVIRDTGADFEYKGVFVEVKYEVNYVPSEGKINCSCLRYECYGLLCRHIFYVLRLSKNHMYVSLLGVTEPEEVTIHLPNGTVANTSTMIRETARPKKSQDNQEVAMEDIEEDA
nr:FAR1 DNA binding domain, zinc finger, SWIM-type, MULE transposase domain, FHY3/FAR1 family [Tanacetum cinerariifolium]